eukprot:364529-Chlamydomonas_euryale.AAC.3
MEPTQGAMPLPNLALHPNVEHMCAVAFEHAANSLTSMHASGLSADIRHESLRSGPSCWLSAAISNCVAPCHHRRSPCHHLRHDGFFTFPRSPNLPPCALSFLKPSLRSPFAQTFHWCSLLA